MDNSYLCQNLHYYIILLSKYLFLKKVYKMIISQNNLPSNNYNLLLIYNKGFFIQIHLRVYLEESM